MKWIAVVLALYASALSLVQCQDYAEYARGAGIGRRRNNRYDEEKTSTSKTVCINNPNFLSAEVLSLPQLLVESSALDLACG